MSYQTGEANWLTRLQAMSQFTGNNSARGKWGLMNRGADNQYAILKPGPAERVMISSIVRQNTWRTIIQLWQRYKDDGTSMTDLEALVSAVLTELDKYRFIGAGADAAIQDANITEVRETQEIRATPSGGPLWLMVELVGEWNEEETISPAE